MKTMFSRLILALRLTLPTLYVIPMLFLKSALALTPQEIKTISNSLNSINNGLAQKNTAVCCDPEEQLNQLQLKCAMDLCGSPSEVDSAYILDQDFKEQFYNQKLEDDFNKFKPKLRDYAQKSLERAKKMINETNDRLAKNPDHLSMALFDQQDQEAMIEYFLEKRIKTKIKYKDAGPREVQVTYTDLETMPSELKSIAKRYAYLKEENIKNDFETGLKADLYSLEEAKSLMAKELKKTLSRYKDLKTVNPSYVSQDFLNLYFLDGNAADFAEEISNADSIIELEHNAARLKLARKSLAIGLKEDGALYAEKVKEFKCDLYDCKAALDYLIKNFDIEKKLELAKAELKKDPSALIESCRFNWYEKAMKAPEREKQIQFIEKMPLYIERFQERFVKKHFSKESSIFIDMRLQNLNKTFTNFREQEFENKSGADYLKESINERLSNEASLAPNPSSSVSPYSDTDNSMPELLKDIKRIDKIFSNDRPNLLPVLKASCRDSLMLLEDEFSRFDDALHTSGYSCNHPEAGKQIFTHELGHALSAWFIEGGMSKHSSESFIKTRKCIQSQYRSAPSRDYFHEGDSIYVEEDMSDFIASSVYQDSKENLFSCSLFKPSPDKKTWEDVKLLNPDKESYHSGDLFRAIIEAKRKSRLIPTSCQEVMGAFKHKVQYVDCK